jgi:lysozyme family protein
MTKTDFITNLLAAEGGYVNDPRDSGGETNYGITVATATRERRCSGKQPSVDCRF